MLSLLTCAALTACATTQPGVEVRTQIVKVPVPQACPATPPQRPAKLGKLPADANAALALTLGKLAEYSGPGGYADRATVYFETCRPSPAP